MGYVATELNANPRDLDLYARRQPTLSAHMERVREHLGLTAFDETARPRLAPFVFKEAFRLSKAPPSCPAARSTFVNRTSSVPLVF